MRSSVRSPALAWLAILLAPLAVRAASPRDELLRFVPERVGFCVVLQDLRGHAAALDASPFVEQVRKTPFVQALLGAPETKQIGVFEQMLEKQLGLSLTQIRDDILGDALVFAYRPGPPGKPEQEQELLLVRAREAKPLEKLIERLNELQKGTGEVSGIEKRTHKGLTYFVRMEKRRPSFYYLRGPVLVVSGQEEMLLQALDQERLANPEAKPALVRKLEQVGFADDLLSVWINPRAFDAELDAKLAQAGQEGAPELRTFATYWKAIDGVALSVRLQKELSFSLALQAKTDALPAAARRFFTQLAEPSELWRAFPEDALLALGSRFDGSALLSALSDFLPGQARQALETELNRSLGKGMDKDFIKDVLPMIGPDWGVCVTAPAAQDKGWLPQSVFAVRVRSGDASAPVDRALFESLTAFAQLAVFNHNRPPRPLEQSLTLKKATLDGQDIRYLAGDAALPPGIQPAFSLQHGYLLLGSSPEALRRVGARLTTRGPAPAGPVPLVRVSFKELRRYLSERQDAVVKFIAEKNQQTEAEVRQSLEGLLAGLEFVDSLELRHRPGDGQTVVQLVLRTAQPLRK
jgi:hypothetical protein